MRVIFPMNKKFSLCVSCIFTISILQGFCILFAFNKHLFSFCLMRLIPIFVMLRLTTSESGNTDKN
ncbi:hypothetical protein ABW13_23305 [Pluralibacter gergoviae]|nr:hypothetical protein ABW13_23305 [Pluralibacter gergoviae]